MFVAGSCLLVHPAQGTLCACLKLLLIMEHVGRSLYFSMTASNMAFHIHISLFGFANIYWAFSLFSLAKGGVSLINVY